MTLSRLSPLFACIALATLASAAPASKVITLRMAEANGPGDAAGTITVTESKYGLVFLPALSGLPPGLHGFHVHENGSCDAAMKDGKMTPAAAAGGHYDPKKTGKHDSPWGDGHLGDLPALYVDKDGKATNPVLAPRLKMKDLKGRSLMVHAGGDNHADHPMPVGGGGARIACGVVE
ncbi:MAG TPA: superoxide dismutase [Cu-Zn] SodC [Fibrobacteria bacterium]|nr:superoxide dismutase [Cu-Zn] SodC [Fibrobacteria bacterium]